MPTPMATESRAIPRILVQCLGAARALARIVMGLLREIGDENAYARFLAARGCAHSADAWRQFSDERLRAKYVRPKCC